MFPHLLTLPSVLLLAWCVIGRIPIPIPVPQGPEAARQHWEGVAGGPESSARVRVGKSDRTSVLSVLGKPDYIDGGSKILRSDFSTGQFWEYRHLQVSGYMLCLMPGPCNPLWGANYSRDDWLAIWFDSNGRVSKYAVWSQYPPPPDVAEEERRWRNAPATQP